jgi:hypothetical protein
MTAPQPSLPANLAFVVQFHAQPLDAPQHWAGRVEHLASGQAARFQSLDELWCFIARVRRHVQSQQDPA